MRRAATCAVVVATSLAFHEGTTVSAHYGNWAAGNGYWGGWWPSWGGESYQPGTVDTVDESATFSGGFANIQPCDTSQSVGAVSWGGETDSVDEGSASAPVSTQNKDEQAGNSKGSVSNSVTQSSVVDSSAASGAGEVFDGKLQTYQRSDVTCDESAELTGDSAVFIVESGATLQNVIISGGISGVYCASNNCSIINTWSDSICQAAVVVVEGVGTTVISGGGARNATSRVVLGQSSGTVTISGGFYTENSAMVFESCGTCGPVKREVILDGVTAVNPTAELVRVNENYHDLATIANATVVTTDTEYAACTYYDAGTTPKQAGSGVLEDVCAYSSTTVQVITSS